MLAAGFQIETPPVFVPWSVSTDELQALLPVTPITDGCYTARCTSLGGLEHMLGFHFEDDVLDRLEFFLETERAGPEQEYAIWQRHLENAFGPPTETSKGYAGFPSHHWSGIGATVHHFVTERFGLNEHVGITKP